MGYQKQRVPVVSGAAGYERVADQYDKDEKDYDEIDQRLYSLALPRELTGLKILDAGGGTGRWAARLTKRGADVTLADPSPAMMAIAKQKDGKIKLVEAYVEKLPLEDATFDVTICSFVLGYVDDLRGALTELVRVTKTGGLLLIAMSPERKSPLHRVEKGEPFLLDVTYHRPEQIVRELEDLGCSARMEEVLALKKDVVIGRVIIAGKS